MFFFLLWPLFARAPRRWFLEIFLLSAPVCKVFFFVALRWAPRPFGGAGAKKNTTQGVFFCSGPGESRARRSPVGRRHGARAKKKHHPGCFFFCCGPGERQGKEKPRWAGARAGVFFCSGPVPAPNGASPCPAFPRGRSKKKTPWVVFFFALAPSRRPTGLLLPLPFAGAAAKKHPGWCFFFFALAPCRHGASPSPAFPRGRSKKKTPWVVFFFLLRPRADAHSLTAGLGGDASSLAGVVFFFAAAARPDRGGVFFFGVAPPGRSLTHCGLGRFRQGPGGVFFFLLRPRRVFLDNSKKCLGYYIGSKKTRRGHNKKKNTTSIVGA